MDQDNKHPKETPGEDLMSEHGILNRILLIYEESIKRFNAPEKSFNPDVLKESVNIIRTFIEDYHEKTEENYIFPKFEEAGKMVDLVSMLRIQHQVGRNLTDNVLNIIMAPELKLNLQNKKIIEVNLQNFISMYRVHESREDTELFPEFRHLVTVQEYALLGELFEEKEHNLFGIHGFKNILTRITDMEKELDIYDLAKFIPKDQ